MIDRFNEIENRLVKEQRWTERCKLIKEYHDLKQKTFGKANGGRPGRAGKTGWSIRDTAEALNMKHSTIHNEICLALAVEKNQKLKKRTRIKVLEKIKGD